MAIHLEGQLVSSGFDEVSKTCSYTFEHEGKRWTVRVPLHELEKHGANAQRRRGHVTQLVTTAMQGPHDDAE